VKFLTFFSQVFN